MIMPDDWAAKANGRKIAVWGTGRDAPQTITEIYEAGHEVGFFVSRDWIINPCYVGKKVFGKDILDRENHYVVIGTTLFYEAIRESLLEAGFKEGLDFAALKLPVVFDIRGDRRENGVFIGRGSFFPELWSEFMVDEKHGGVLKSGNCVESIGRFTSINGTAQVLFDHPIKTISTSSVMVTLIEKNERMRLWNKHNRFLPRFNRVKIGSDVWIGANVFINASKVKEIGDGAVIGAGAVVLEDVPPYAVVVGVPGKIKKYRYTPEQIECLLRVKWWDWSDGEINENAELMFNPEMFFEKFM